MMLEGAGFEVIDLGINNAVEKYLAALEQHKPDFLGMSALLTTTMPYMKVVIDTLKEKSLRDKYIVLVGGAPLNEEFGKADRRRRLLPRRGDRGRDREAAARRAPRGRPCSLDEPRHRLRRARARDRGAASANGWTLARRRLPAARAAQPARAHRAGAVREKIREHRKRVRRHLRRLRRLRDAAARSTPCSPRRASNAFPGAHCYEFFAGAADSRRWPRRSPAPST